MVGPDVFGLCPDDPRLGMLGKARRLGDTVDGIRTDDRPADRED
jgi:hypothetical protein